MIDHVSLQVDDVANSTAFYEALLAPLGLAPAFNDGEAVGFSDGVHAPLWLSPTRGTGNRELHLAFDALERHQVDAFFQAALGLGAEVLHAPREFPEYHPGYFACFVRDPDGHNVEAVCHLPDPA
jgi:catechol 2,3-dioxygenase-like lactoylglutathione lyase family enzyme